MVKHKANCVFIVCKAKDVSAVWHFHNRPATFSWWRHQMETFSALLAICAGNSPVPGEFRAQRPVTRSFDVFFDLSPNKRLSKQWWGWWFKTQSWPLWRHRDVRGWGPPLGGGIVIWLARAFGPSELDSMLSVYRDARLHMRWMWQSPCQMLCYPRWLKIHLQSKAIHE